MCAFHFCSPLLTCTANSSCRNRSIWSFNSRLRDASAPRSSLRSRCSASTSLGAAFSVGAGVSPASLASNTCAAARTRDQCCSYSACATCTRSARVASSPCRSASKVCLLACSIAATAASPSDAIRETVRAPSVQRRLDRTLQTCTVVHYSSSSYMKLPLEELWYRTGLRQNGATTIMTAGQPQQFPPACAIARWCARPRAARPRAGKPRPSSAHASRHAIRSTTIPTSLSRDAASSRVGLIGLCEGSLLPLAADALHLIRAPVVVVGLERVH